MSTDVNTQLLERAAELIDEFTSHPSRFDIQLEQAIDRNDLEEVQRLVTQGEAILAEEHFYNHNILSNKDVF